MNTRRALVLAGALAFTTPALASTQAIATLAGTVRDEAGGVAGARVLAIDTLTNERRRTTTNDRGFFRMLDLAPGHYVVTAMVLGRVATTQALRLASGERAHLDLVLDRAPGVLDAVRVHEQRGSAAAVERMSVSTTITTDEIERLPLNSRNVMSLAAAAPGMRSFQPVSGYSLPAAGALRDERAINLYVDGVEMKNFNSSNVVGSPQSGSVIPVDAVEELRVLLNPYDAEYARGAAYVLSAVTHRGTNETHGSAFGHFQSRDLVSVTPFQRAIPNFEKPDFSRQQLGFSLRGPVVRDRLFYAATVELSLTDNQVAVVPGQPAADPTRWDGYAGIFNAPHRNRAGLLRTTYAVNEANLLEAIVSSRYFTGESGFGGIETHDAAYTQKYAVDMVNLRHRWLPASGLANELSLQFLGWASEHRPIAVGPVLRYPTLVIGRSDGRFEIHETQLRAVERVTYGIGSGPGSHLFKAGLEVSRVKASQFAPNGAQGIFRFTSETGNPVEGSVGVGLTDPRSDRDALATLAGWVAGVYVNDEWHPTSRLVLNLGLRYDADLHTMNNDFVVPWTSDPTLASRPELEGLLNHGERRDDLNNVSPRFSFSWDATGNRRTFVRGGFGIMHDRIPGFVPFGERLTATWRTYTFANPGSVDPAELRNRVIAGGGTPVPPSMTLLPQRMDVPENRQWSIGLGTRLTSALALNVDYVDQDLRNLYASFNVNWLDLSQTPARRVLSPAYGNIMVWGDFGRARYRAVLTSISYVPDTTLRLTLSHTLASARADWDVQNVAVPATVASGYYVMQRTSGDERHRVVLSGTWALRGGIGLSTIATAASPRPYRTMVGQDLNRNNLLDDDWIDGTRYAVPPNAWSNWYRVVDLRVTKSIGIVPGARLSVIAEAFNLFNTENYAGYFGVQRSATGAARPDFGTPSGVFATRQLQFGSRVQF
jgi:hypothetical protein